MNGLAGYLCSAPAEIREGEAEAMYSGSLEGEQLQAKYRQSSAIDHNHWATRQSHYLQNVRRKLLNEIFQHHQAG